jgi:spermidine synthase
MSVRTRLVGLLFFGSGFCALIYQTTWLREFRLVFGGSTAATAAVLGVFMAGLGFGGIVLGQRSENKARPLRFYAQLELLIAGGAALSPLLILGARYLYIALGGTQALGLSVGTIARLILAGLIIGPPTFLMGGTLPAAARAVVEPDDIPRRMVGILYGANGLGAVVGAAASTFYFLEHFGNHATIWLAATLNTLVALTAFFVSKSTADSKPGSTPSGQFDNEGSGVRASARFVFVAAGAVGFAFFLMELVWYRMLGPLFGGTTFSFGLILAVALLGISVGGGAYGLFGLKRSASLQFFAMTCAAEALFIALPYAIGDKIATAAMLLWPLGRLGFYGHVIAWTTLCFVVVFPAAAISGLQFPLLIALLGKGRKCVGVQTGTAYAWNTIGALIGSLAGGFGFIPMFSAPGVWKIVVILLCALAIIAALVALSESRCRAMVTIPVLTVALALVMLMADGPTAFWRHSDIGVGRLTYFQSSRNQMRELKQAIRRHILWQKDGIESSVALANYDGLSFILNGRTDGNAKSDAGTQIMSGLIPAALHPRPATAMVVGLGTGSTAGWLAAIPDIERVDVIELEPAILKVAEACAPVNQNALSSPKLHTTIGDAREILLTTQRNYDLIASEPSNPHRAGTAGLFTREYYQAIEKRLNPGGIFVQWVQAYDVDDRSIQIMYRTLGSVFPNIESWQTNAGDLLLSASREPVHYDMQRLRTRLAEEPFRSALLAAWRANGVEDFLAHYVGNQTVTETLQHLGTGPLNTDDRTVIEFAFARSLGLLNGFELPDLRAGTHQAGADRPLFVNGDIDWSRVNEGRISIYPGLSRAAQFQETLAPAQRIRASAYVKYMDGDLPGALAQWRLQSKEPETLSQLTMLAECLAAEGDDAARPYLERLAQILPLENGAISAELAWVQKMPEEAADTLEKFFRSLRNEPWPPRELIKRSLRRAETIARSDGSRAASGLLYDAIRMPLCVFNNEADRRESALVLAVYLDGSQPGERTVRELEAFEPHVVWERNFLEVRKTCYVAMHNPRAQQASRDLDEFVKNEAPTADVSALAKKIKSYSAETTSGPSSNQLDKNNLRQ